MITLALVVLLLLPELVFSVEQLSIDNTTSPDYLPYRLDSLEAYSLQLKSPKQYRSMQVCCAHNLGGDQGRMIRGINVDSNSVDKNRFSLFEYPNWQIVQVREVDFTILDWKVIGGGCLEPCRFVAVGKTGDSLVACLGNFEETGIPYTRASLCTLDGSTNGVASAFVVTVGNFDADSTLEAMVYVSGDKLPRKLICIDLAHLTIQWQLNVSSPISRDRIFPVTYQGSAAAAVLTENPGHNVSDSLFNDNNAYYFIVDESGNVVVKRYLSCEFTWKPAMCPASAPDQFYVSHRADISVTPDTTRWNEMACRISLINPGGQKLASVIVQNTPLRLSLVPYGPEQKLHIWAKNLDGSVDVFDSSLTHMAHGARTGIGSYLGRALIEGLADSIYVFSDGLYTSNLTKVLDYQAGAGMVRPIALDRKGQLRDILLVRDNWFGIYRISRKTFLELVGVFYHHNQVYILMALSGLLVGLVSVAVSRKRVRTNLRLIQTQKLELEQTHAALKKAQADLIAAEKFRQAKDIAGGFAHEIRNALFPADSLLTKLRSKAKSIGSDPYKLAQYHTDVHKAVARAVGITQLISHYTKLDAECFPETIELSAIVTEFADSFQRTASDRGIETQRDIEPGLNITANRKQVEMVLSNLLINAVDALSDVPNGRIQISVHGSDNNIRMVVADNGIGLPEGEEHRIFDTFFSTKPSSGTGMGLSTVKKIVEMYGGSIAARNSSPGGAEFIVLWKPANGLTSERKRESDG